jgi:diguanylate cyclase (GGDEF)-like protein
MLTISTVFDAGGKPQHYVAIFSDVTEAKQHEQQLHHIAHYDALTNLPNRVLLADRLTQSMLQSQRRGLKLAVIFLDLDGFKAINDNFGHDAGDHLLAVLANRMKMTLREGDTLARIGGDEFVAVLVDMATDAESLPMLKRLLGAVAEPIAFNDSSLLVTASLGVTFYPQESDIDADQLQRQADQAMYQAKLLGKNRFHIFDTEHDRSVRGHNESLEELREALGNGQLTLFFQPKVNMRSGGLVGVEALIRWQHPTRGLLGPGVFLPIIENHALAIDVGEWVIHTALDQVQVWHGKGLDLPVSVNLGARQLQQRDFVGRLRTILSQHPLVPAGSLELEVLETSALEDISGVTHVIEQCRLMGVLFALDDFGTGYSSLNYLKRLPVARIKIDQSFVRDMLDDADDLAILQGVIGLAHAFKREVIAEGVETVAHGSALLQLGCELAQGYGIGKPMPGPDLLVWAQRWRSEPTWMRALGQQSAQQPTASISPLETAS